MSKKPTEKEQLQVKAMDANIEGWETMTVPQLKEALSTANSNDDTEPKADESTDTTTEGSKSETGVSQDVKKEDEEKPKPAKKSSSKDETKFRVIRNGTVALNNTDYKAKEEFGLVVSDLPEIEQKRLSNAIKHKMIEKV